MPIVIASCLPPNACFPTHDPPKRAPKPAPDHIALVVRGHMQRGFGIKFKAEMLEGEIVVFHESLQF